MHIQQITKINYRQTSKVRFISKVQTRPRFKHPNKISTACIEKSTHSDKVQPVLDPVEDL